MSGNIPFIFPYKVDWDGRDGAHQSFLRACIALGADLSRSFEGPSLLLAQSRPIVFDVDLSRLIERIRRIPGMQSEPPPSRGFQPPSAIVGIAYGRPFDMRIVQVIQRLISAAPPLERAAFILLCDFQGDRTLGPSLPACGALDRNDPQRLPILALNATGIRLLVVDLDIPYPLPELSIRLRELLTPAPPRTGPRPSASEPALPAIKPPLSVPRFGSGEMPRIVLDPALRTGEDKK